MTKCSHDGDLITSMALRMKESWLHRRFRYPITEQTIDFYIIRRAARRCNRERRQEGWRSPCLTALEKTASSRSALVAFHVDWSSSIKQLEPILSSHIYHTTHAFAVILMQAKPWNVCLVLPSSPSALSIETGDKYQISMKTWVDRIYSHVSLAIWYCLGCYLVLYSALAMLI